MSWALKVERGINPEGLLYDAPEEQLQNELQPNVVHICCKLKHWASAGTALKYFHGP